MTIPPSQRAWQDNPEPPDHDEPTLFDRLEAMPHEELWNIIVGLHEDHGNEVADDIEMWVSAYEREQLARLATP